MYSLYSLGIVVRCSAIVSDTGPMGRTVRIIKPYRYTVYCYYGMIAPSAAVAVAAAGHS